MLSILLKLLEVTGFNDRIKERIQSPDAEYQQLLRQIERLVKAACAEYRNYSRAGGFNPRTDVLEAHDSGIAKYVVRAFEERRELQAEGLPLSGKVTDNERLRLYGYIKKKLEACIEWVRRSDAQNIAQKLEVLETGIERVEEILQSIHSNLKSIKDALPGLRDYACSVSVDKPLYEQPFTLRDMYIPLNVWRYEKKTSDGRGKEQELVKRVFISDTFLDDWCRGEGNSLMILGGEPGGGKSTAAMMLVDRLADMSGRFCFYMPLKHFRTIKGAIDLLDTLPRIDATLVLIFDGLDEIMESGENTETLAKRFLEGIDQQLEKMSELVESWDKVRVLVTGRSVVLDVMPPQFGRRTIHLFPYFVEDRRGYEDPDGLLDEDKRDIWWKKYGQYADNSFEQMPDKLKRWDAKKGDKSPLTMTPVLNLLIALNYEELDFTGDANLASIYETMLRGVFERDYAMAGKSKERGTGGHSATRDVVFSDYLAFLEQLGLAAWQAPDEQVDFAELERRCTKGRLEEICRRFIDDKSVGIKNLMLSFYMRHSGSSNRNEPHEFVHRSFMEYLVSRAIYQLVAQIPMDAEALSDELRSELFDELAVAPLTEHICDFLRSEYMRPLPENEDSYPKIQKLLLQEMADSIASPNRLFSGGKRIPFADEKKRVANYQTALLAVHSCIATHSKHVTSLDAEAIPNGFYNWLVEVSGHSPVTTSLPRQCLNHIAFISSHYAKQLNFFCANLQHANLQHAYLQHAYLQRAHLQGAHLQGAYLQGAYLQGAYLQGANHQDANLQDANLQGANLRGANLQDANLQGADLRGAYLQHAHLQGMDFRGVDFRGAHLQGVDFRGAILCGTDLRRTEITVEQLQSARYDATTMIDEELWKHLFPDKPYPDDW
ncbi:MAG: pentapeptide repeat-containing protein [Coriobacteriales bacterium]|jgi:uncharacterized protein YjbI with pentapeptide repeats|nr:pentapeptide repeat-containing protein [Coriobacteriales bacterium]